MLEIRIILDLDDVLADFVGAMCNLHGVSRKELDEVRKEWDIVPALNELRTVNQKPVTQDSFWRTINQVGDYFWANLDALPWCEELIEIVSMHG